MQLLPAVGIARLDAHLDTLATAEHANLIRTIRVSAFGTKLISVAVQSVARQWLDQGEHQATDALKSAYNE